MSLMHILQFFIACQGHHCLAMRPDVVVLGIPHQAGMRHCKLLHTSGGSDLHAGSSWQGLGLCAATQTSTCCS